MEISELTKRYVKKEDWEKCLKEAGAGIRDAMIIIATHMSSAKLAREMIESYPK